MVIVCPKELLLRKIAAKVSSSSQTGYSKANVVLKNVSIPLAWPAEEYFGNTKEWREFTVQLVVRTSEGKETFSKPRESINRTYTDVDFNDVFFFEDQSPEFCFEVILYCKRTDVNANPNMVQTLSRSLGRSIGTSLKKYMRSANNTFSGASRLYPDDNVKDSHLSNDPVYRTEHNLDVGSIDPDFLENYRNPEKMCALGTGRFRLRNATLSGRTHTYNLELVPHGTYPGVTRSQLLPVYGNICAQLLVQPTSLCGPLAQGQLDMFFVEGGILLQRMFCVLQGGLLKCYNDYGNDETDKSSSELSKVTPTAKQPPALTLQINQVSNYDE
ncbi:cell division protein anillin domain-containing protein [Ditylenchus destructor]|uniref:Cell division protein anillin domain-containing protein n=1 Tax=Ditylenchus destructor TaxID=166010 RepID=A0AAD4NGE0_9BILA|nr:cell division protein anillin domain-containing protein [Ditylenchus destructor]